MALFISHLSHVFGSILFSFIVALITGVLYAITQLIFKSKKTKEISVFAQHMALRIGALHALVVAFVFGIMTGELTDLHQTTEAEAISAGNTYWALKGVQAPEAILIRNLTFDYLKNVIESDWNSTEPNPYKRTSWNLIERMKEVIAQWKPYSTIDELKRSYALKNIDTLSESRDMRILESISPNLPALFWLFCILGYFLTLFPYLTAEHSNYRLILITGFALINGLILYGLLALDNPQMFHIIRPDAFEEMLQQIVKGN